MKCMSKKETIRGYPFYFFFEDLDNVQSYFIDKTDEIKFINLNYKEVNSNIFEIRYLGEMDKNNLTLTHTKGGEKYNCNFCDNLRFRSTKWLDFITNRNS